MKNLFILLILLTSSHHLLAQSNKTIRPYLLDVESRYQVSQTEVEDGFVDIYTVFELDSIDRPKYLIYAMDSKLESNLSIDRINSYTFDLNCNVIRSYYHEHSGLKGIELIVDYSNRQKQVMGQLFITKYSGNRMFRILFMMPNKTYYEKYINEYDKIVSGLKFND